MPSISLSTVDADNLDDSEDDDEERTQAIILYENTIRQFILSVEHIRNIVKSHTDSKAFMSNKLKSD